MEEKILTLSEAIKAYNEGKRVLTNVQGEKTFLIVLGENRLKLVNEYLSMEMSVQGLIRNFGDLQFVVIEDESVEIDPLKDAEYYSWKQ